MRTVSEALRDVRILEEAGRGPAEAGEDFSS